MNAPSGDLEGDGHPDPIRPADRKEGSLPALPEPIALRRRWRSAPVEPQPAPDLTNIRPPVMEDKTSCGTDAVRQQREIMRRGNDPLARRTCPATLSLHTSPLRLIGSARLLPLPHLQTSLSLERSPLVQARLQGASSSAAFSSGTNRQLVGSPNRTAP